MYSDSSQYSQQPYSQYGREAHSPYSGGPVPSHPVQQYATQIPSPLEIVSRGDPSLRSSSLYHALTPTTSPARSQSEPSAAQTSPSIVVCRLLYIIQPCSNVGKGAEPHYSSSEIGAIRILASSDCSISTFGGRFQLAASDRSFLPVSPGSKPPYGQLNAASDWSQPAFI
jgi:hypothetical protein